MRWGRDSPIRSGSRAIGWLIGGLATLVLASPAGAATIPVNTTTDELTPSDGLCSLREAASSADFNFPDGDCVQGDETAEDTIQLGPGTYNLVDPFGTIFLQQPTATGGVTIVGAGMSSTTIHADTGFDAGLIATQAPGPLTIRDLTLDGGGSEATVFGGVESITNSLTLEHVGITNNMGDFGGGVYFQPNTTTHPNAALTITDSVIDNNTGTHNFFTSATGAGVSTQGKSTISRTAVTNNKVLFTGADTDGSGGGIYSTGDLTLVDDLISGNTIDVTRNGSGGGVHAQAGLTAVNVTLTGNTVTAGTGRGGALSTQGFLSAALTNVTIAGNSATIGSAIAHTNPVSLSNSIIDNGVGACDTLLTALGGNLDHAASCWLSGAAGPGDLQDADPMLDVLADNGGPTLTMALLSGSPAIDHVPTASCVDQQTPTPQAVSTDQRGITRPQGVDCDSGAFEFVPAVVPPPPTSPTSTPITTVTGQRAAAIKRCKKKFRKGTKKRKKCLRRAKRLPL